MQIPVAKPHDPTLRVLPQALLATFVVIGVPPLAATAMLPSGNAALVALSAIATVAASVGLAAIGSAIWARRPDSQDLVFGDLMLWGWLRRYRAERRLAEARTLLGSSDAVADRELTRDELCTTLQRLAGLLEARDAYTHGHTRRVTRHAERIARSLGLSDDDVAEVRVAAALHDVGKVNTPREVLTKPGRLTDQEFEVVKRHPVDGAKLVEALGDPNITAMVRHHHERLDGNGYPDGLAGDAIPLGARIIAVADTFDAITSSRPYRSASQHKEALDVLAKEAGTQLDPAAVDAFTGYYSGRRAVGWFAALAAAPARLLGWVSSSLQGAGAAQLAQGALATGLAAIAGGSLGGPAPPATAQDDTRPRAQLTRPVATSDVGTDRTNATTNDNSRSGGEKRTSDDPERRRSGRRPSRSPGGDGLRGEPRGGQPDDSPRTDVGSPDRAKPGGDGPKAVAPPAGGDGEQPPPPADEPEIRVPGVEIPGVEVPGVEVPGVEVPGVELPGVEVPGVSVPGVDVDVPDLHVPDVELPSLGQ